MTLFNRNFKMVVNIKSYYKNLILVHTDIF